MKTTPRRYYTPGQGRILVFLSDFLTISDPVLAFDRFMEGIDLSGYLRKIPEYITGRNRYDPVDMLKTVLFAFADNGYCSLRKPEDNCRVNMRCMYLMKGRRKAMRQRHCERLQAYMRKPEEYRKKLTICGDARNSHAGTDHSATFMRMKRNCMGNDRLLPAYNIQIGAADAYIAAADVKHYRSDMDRFVPPMEKFRSLYGFYPEYPAADAGYGSYNNCLYCEAHGMKKYMRFTMFDKESKDRKDRENPYRSETAYEPFDSDRGYIWRYEIRPKLQADGAQGDRFRQT